MKQKEIRLKQIMRILQSHPQIHVNTLQRLTDFSTSSLRRDLVDLEKHGLIQRSFGNVKLINQQNLEYTWGFRQSENIVAKDKICEIASSFIEDNDAIFMDASTTGMNILNHVDEISGLKIITNNLKVAERVQANPHITGFLAGGELRALAQTIIGVDANDFIKQFHAKLAFISASMIDQEGLYMADVAQTQIKKTMMENSTIVIALMDHSKFTNKNNFVKLCDLSKLDYLITDRPIPEGPTLSSLKRNKVNILYKKPVKRFNTFNKTY